MQHTRWERRNKQAHLLSDAGKELGTFPQPLPAHATVTLADGTEWDIHSDAKEIAIPKAGFQATGGKKKWQYAKEVTIALGERELRAVNEARNDWVYEAGEQKLGQFSGGNRGVRQAITEFEPDSEFSEQEQIFLSLVTRMLLDARAQRTQMVWLVTMVLMTIAIIITFII